MNQIKTYWNRYREVIFYLIFGVLTTVVNYIVYFLATRVFSIHYMAATIIAWIVAVIFAYVTNRRWVFQSNAETAGARRGEFIKFTGGRILSLLLEAVIMFVGVELLQLRALDWAVKTVAQVFVVIFNYVLSKFFVFK